MAVGTREVNLAREKLAQEFNGVSFIQSIGAGQYLDKGNVVTTGVMVTLREGSSQDQKAQIPSHVMVSQTDNSTTEGVRVPVRTTIYGDHIPKKKGFFRR